MHIVCPYQYFPTKFGSNWPSDFNETNYNASLSTTASKWLQYLPNISALRRGALDTTLCDKVCQWLATDRWFFSGFLYQYNWNIVECSVKHHKPN